MTSGPRAASLSPQSCTQLQSAPGVDAALVTELGAVWKQQRLRLIPGSRLHPWGTWCSGITSAPHAEGPGFKSQCVHSRNMSAAAAAAEIQRKLLRPCFALSCCVQCQCHLFCASPCSHPHSWPAAAAHLAAHRATATIENMHAKQQPTAVHVLRY